MRDAVKVPKEWLTPSQIEKKVFVKGVTVLSENLEEASIPQGGILGQQYKNK